MATRSGSVDPGALIALLRDGVVTVDELDRALEHESGLQGLAGTSHVAELDRSSDPAARLALSVFTHRVAGAVAAMAASLNGLDALVFSGGIGENSALVRESVCRRLGFLGVEIDPAANESARPDCEIAQAGSSVGVFALRSREELVIARETRRLLA